MTRNSISFLLCFFISISSLSTQFATAEDKDSRGRLPDGRAFRTDSEGNQLVDYIAELEMSVDTLNRRVRGLEGEVEQKQAQLDSLHAGGATAPKLQERDLTSGVANKNQAGAVVCPEVPDCAAEVRRAEAMARSQNSGSVSEISNERERCYGELTRTQSMVSTLQNQLQGKNAELRTLQTSFASTSNESGQIQDLIKSKQVELKSLRAKLEEVSNEIETLTSELNEKMTKIASIQDQINEADIDNSKLASKLEASRNRKVDLEIREAAASKVESPTLLPASGDYREMTQSDEDFNSRASLSLSRVRAVDSMRGTMLSSMNQIQGLISQRDRLYAQYVTTSASVKFRPSPAVSSRRQNLSLIREGIRNATSAQELSELSRDLNEIRSRIESDIALMQRVRRLG